MTESRRELEEEVKSLPWFHSIDLGQGVWSAGSKSREQLEHELKVYRIPDVRGKSVLDIGAWDGFFSFAVERMGARRVVALDEFVWALDLEGYVRHSRECKNRGEAPEPHKTSEFWHPRELPGKRAFDLARKTLHSRVEARVADFMEMDLAALGTFDVVLYLGVLYHMENPFEALQRVARVTGEVAVIETQAVALAGYEDRAMWEFYPGDELNQDPTNWWAPNQRALEGACRAAGFQRIDVIAGSPLAGSGGDPVAPSVLDYRAILHAWK